MKILSVFLAGAVFYTLGAPAFCAEESSDATRKALTSVRSLELPREVARLIENTPERERHARSPQIVRSAIELNPAAAAAIVGAASRVAPEAAPQIVKAAVELLPALAPGIARAGAASAPRYSPEIAAAAAKVLPSQFAQISYEVGYAVPGKDTEIVNAVMAGLPNLKALTPSSAEQWTLPDLMATAPGIRSAARQLGMKEEQLLTAELTSAQLVTAQAAVQSAAATRDGSAMAVSKLGGKGGSFVPAAGKPGEANRAQTVTVTPGQGRSYFAPRTRPGYGK